MILRPDYVPRGRFLTRDEIDQADDLEWLVDGLIPTRSLAVLFGESGAHKSFLALDLTLTLASGGEWLGKKIRQGTAVYLWGEGRAGFKTRLQAWIKDRNRGSDGVLFSHHIYLFGEDGEPEVFLKDLRHFGLNPDLIIVDTLSVYFGEDPNENDTNDMRKFCASLRRIIDESGAAVLIIHHANDWGKLRGSKLLRAAADVVLKVTKGTKGNKGLVLVNTDKAREAAEWTDIKLRPRLVQLEDESEVPVLDLVSEGPPRYAAGASTDGMSDYAGQALSLTPRLARAIELIEQHPSGITDKKLMAAMEVRTERTVRGYAKTLAERGLIRIETKTVSGRGSQSFFPMLTKHEVGNPRSQSS